jgi:hypothetical protein
MQTHMRYIQAVCKKDKINVALLGAGWFIGHLTILLSDMVTSHQMS